MNIFIEEGVILEPTAIIKHHVYFGKNTEGRQGTYIRGNEIDGEKHSFIFGFISLINHNTYGRNTIRS